MKTLHIHIGTPKTATTAIQFFCMENAEKLAKEGYCYPIFPFDYPGTNKSHNGSFLLGVLKDKEGKRNTEQEERNFREGMDIVKKLFLEYDHIILSHEGIWRKADSVKKDFWEIMMREAKEAEFQIHVIVYLRRQDEYFLSNWHQRTKKLCSEETIEEYAKRVNYQRWDYYGKLEKISAVIGKENITVRRFDKNRLEGGSIYSDFLSVFGLALTEEYIISQEVRNTGLYGNMHEIKRVMNTMPSMKNEKVQMFVTDILRECSDISRKEYPCEIYSKEEIMDFLENYREKNQKVAEEYLQEESGSDLFDYTVPDLPKWKKDNPYMTDDIIRVLGKVMLCLYQHEQEMEQMKRSIWHIKNPFWSVFHRIKNKIRFEK